MLDVAVKLEVGVDQAVCVVNTADPVVASTNTPLMTADAVGIIAVPVNSLVAPYAIPLLTLDALGYVCGSRSVYKVLV